MVGRDIRPIRTDPNLVSGPVARVMDPSCCDNVVYKVYAHVTVVMVNCLEYRALAGAVLQVTWYDMS